jgi:hypothetical protein
VPAGELHRAGLIVGLDRVDELAVLFPRPVRAGRCDEPVVPADPVAYDAGQVGEHGVPGDFGDRGVEGAVAGDGGRDVVGIGGGPPVLPDLPKLLHLLRCRVMGGEPRGLGLEQLAHVEQFVDFLIGRHVHERPLGGAKLDPAFRLQPVQRLTDRLPADSELPGQVRLHPVLIGAEVGVDDQVHERLVDRLPQGNRPRHRLNRRSRSRYRHSLRI